MAMVTLLSFELDWGMDALPGGRGVLLGYGKKTENLMLWDMAEERAIHLFPSQPSPVLPARTSVSAPLFPQQNGSNIIYYIVLITLQRLA